jgi:GrpB-like predicted nucleotidyltransferase (UPF0157 family)
MKDSNKIIIVEYSTDWPLIFEDLKRVYERFLAGLVIDIQHIGSTSVPGLAAKPIIDIDLIIENRNILKYMIVKLEKLGYEYQGDLGIKNREAFKRVLDKTPLDGSDRIWQKHNLYCCTKNSISLRNHLQFRDYLRKDPEKARQYGVLKKKLALQYPLDINIYAELKTSFIVEVLKGTGIESKELESITKQNKAKF